MKHPEFPLIDELIYLNHAAVGPWPKRTGAAVIKFAEQNTRYGSHFYLDWLNKEAELRTQLQALLNAPSPDDIALVKNTSEALSFVAYGLTWQSGDNIVSSNEESLPTDCRGNPWPIKAWNFDRPTYTAPIPPKMLYLRWSMATRAY